MRINITGTVLLFGIIVLLSLYFAYYRCSSPAFQAEFSYALKDELPEDVDKVIENRTQLGLLIEFFRAVICLCFFIILIRWQYKIKSFRKFWDMILSNKSYWIVVAFVAAALIFVVFWYHFYEAPERLAKKAIKWDDLKDTKNVWIRCGDYWEKIYDKREVFEKPGTPEYSKMYKLPYIAYLPYSFIFYVCIVLPILAVFFCFAKSHCKSFATYCDKLEKQLNTSESFEQYNSLIEQFHQAPNLIGLTLSRYFWLFLLFTIVLSYEQYIGYTTLANLARVFVKIGYVSMLVCVLIVLPNIFSYENIHAETSIKSTEFYSGGNCPSKCKERMKLALDELNKYSLVSIILSKKSTGLGLVLLIILFNVLVIFRKSIFG